MKNRPVVISKQIHSSFASWSSGDVILTIVTNENDFLSPIVKDGIIQTKKNPLVNGQSIKEIYQDKQYIGIYVEEDNRFYNMARFSGKMLGTNYSDTPEFSSHIKTYTDVGWKNLKRNERIPAQEAFQERERKRHKMAEKKKGNVLWMGFDALQADKSLYQGGFSDEFFNSKEIQEYISTGCVFGYIGHFQSRTIKNDKQIEKGLRKRGLSNKLINSWVSSTDGRHFGDSLEGYTQKEQTEKIKERLNGMFNLAIIYASNNHEGTLTSTISLTDIYEKHGILLDSKTGKYSEAQHLKSLVKLRETILNETEKTEEVLIIENLVFELFTNKLNNTKK